MRKIIITLFITLTVITTGVWLQGTVPVIAAAKISNSVAYSLGTQKSGILTENGSDKQYYKFTLTSSGSIRITANAYMKWVNLYVYDENANELWHKNPSWNSTSEVIAIDNTLQLASGTYYFCVGKASGQCGNYNFKIDFTSSNESFREVNGGSNNTMASASVIRTDGTSYNAQLALNDEKDFFRFTLQESGKVDFNAIFYGMRSVSWRLYDEAGVELLSNNSSWNDITNNISVSSEIYLTSGTYYFSSVPRVVYIGQIDNIYGKYTFSLHFTSAEENFAEGNRGINNYIYDASPISLEKNYKGQLALNDDVDFYSFSLSQSQTVKINLDAGIECLNVKLYDSDGTEIWSKQWLRWDSTSKRILLSESVALTEGKYYLALEQLSGYCGNYTINISKLTQANCTHEYKSSWHDATYFAKGYRLYTCKICGNSYKGDYQAAKKLAKGYLYSYCSTGKGSLKLSWSTVADASGYQIRYSKNKKMKSGVVTKKIKGKRKSSITIKRLSRKKKYYVQVRPYKTSGSKTVYGKWSPKKCLKTK